MPAEVFQRKESSASEINQDNIHIPTTEITEDTGSEPHEAEMDMTKSNLTVHSTVSSSAFMASRIEKIIDIKSKVVEKKERKTFSKLTSGKAITEPVNRNKIVEHQSTVKGGKCDNVGKGGKVKGGLKKKGKAGKMSHEKQNLPLPNLILPSQVPLTIMLSHQTHILIQIQISQMQKNVEFVSFILQLKSGIV